MSKNIIDFNGYKEFLKAQVQAHSAVRGYQSRLAREAGCQPSYLSKVLNAEADITSDQAINMATFLGLSDQEADLFLAMVDYDRAGSKKAKSLFRNRIKQLKEDLGSITGRIRPRAKEQLEDLYYSRWIYSALHILVSIPDYSTTATAAAQLGLHPRTVESALSQLAALKVVEKQQDRWIPKAVHLHAPIGSQHATNHLTHWRDLAIEHTHRADPHALHYSGVHSISVKDRQRLRSNLLRYIESSQSTIAASKEEELICINIDYFSVDFS